MKTKALLLALCAQSFFTNAQITGQHTYNHAGNAAVLSAGTYVNSNPGFVMAGYIPVTVPGAANFYVDKVNPVGNFTGGFSNEYLFSTFCYNGQWTQEINCYGISLIEQSTGGYAFTASFDSGCLFGFLNAAGGMGINDHFAFPQGARNISKPVITESTANPGNFYVCGSYFDPNINLWQMYAFKFNTAGTILWNQQYDVGTPDLLVPNGIVEGNYNGFPELAIAGTVFNPGTLEDAFFALLDGATGGVNLYEEVDYWGGSAPFADQCTSIALSTVNNGYIIGGSTVNSLASWVVFEQLNANGTVSWMYSPGTNYQASEVIDIEERFSTFYNRWEYYGAVRSPNRMFVMKIGNNTWVPGNNQMYYGATMGAEIACISLRKVNTSSNYGLHAYGTAANGDFVLNQSSFNGATANCPATGSQELLGFAGSIQSQSSVQQKPLNMSPGLGRCVETNQIIVNSITYPVNTICLQTVGLPVAPYAGNNNRTAEITGVSGTDVQNELFNIYPNPVTTKATIEYQLHDNGFVKIELFNNLGQLIATLEDSEKNAGPYSLSLDMKALGVETGIYFVKVHSAGESKLQKLVYSGSN